MDREEDVTVELPVVENDAPPDRVYVPPKTVPPKTKVATMELETVQVRQDLGSRQSPTIRVRRGPSTTDAEEVPTDRPGQVWGHPGTAQPSCAVVSEPPSSPDAVTRRLEIPLARVELPDSDPRAAATLPPAHDARDVPTLSPSEAQAMGLVPCVGAVLVSRDAVTPRPDSRITGEELEAIQSARTLEVPQAPTRASVATERRRTPIVLIGGGVLLGIVIVWTAVLVGRGTRPEAVPVVRDVASTPSGRRSTGDANHQASPPAEVASAMDPVPVVGSTPVAQSHLGPSPTPVVEPATTLEPPAQVVEDLPVPDLSRPTALVPPPARATEAPGPASSATPSRSRAIY